MKKLAILLLLFPECLFSQILNPTCGNWPKTIIQKLDCDSFEGGKWILVFNDEFNSNKIDKGKWHTCEGGWNRVHGNELQYYLDSNIVLEDGVLKLKAKREPGYYSAWHYNEDGTGYPENKYFEYTSGWIESRMDFLYGFFEIRCKIPKGKGFWPAFWLYGGEPEIDIFEFGGNAPKQHYINLHKYGPNNAHIDCSTDENYGIDFSRDYHVFSSEWDEFKIVYRVDGDIKRIDNKWMDSRPVGLYDCQHHTPGLYLINPLFPEKSTRLILNLAISYNGGPFGGAPDVSTIFPSSFDIDYVRIFKKDNSTREVSICNSSTTTSNIITGKSIELGGSSCNFTIPSNDLLDLHAQNRIILKHGFHAKVGSRFSAQISHTNKANVNIQPLINYPLLGVNEIESYEDCNQEQDMSKVLTPALDNGNFKVYPNPCSDYLIIQLQDVHSNYLMIELIDSNGYTTYKEIPATNSININLQPLHKGISLLKVYHINGLSTHKIIHI